MSFLNSFFSTVLLVQYCLVSDTLLQYDESGKLGYITDYHVITMNIAPTTEEFSSKTKKSASKQPN